MIFNVINKITNEKVVVITRKEGIFEAELLNKDDYPVALYGPDFIWEVTSSSIERWLKSRVLPETRQFLLDDLMDMDIPVYNYIVLMRLNGGTCTDDPYKIDIVTDK